MIRNYILIAFRSMKRNLSYTLINVLGFTAGVACCLMLVLYIYDETRFDRHHAKLDNLYRVTTRIFRDGGRGGLFDLALNCQLSVTAGGVDKPGKCIARRVTISQ